MGIKTLGNTSQAETHTYTYESKEEIKENRKETRFKEEIETQSKGGKKKNPPLTYKKLICILGSGVGTTAVAENSDSGADLILEALCFCAQNPSEPCKDSEHSSCRRGPLNTRCKKD